MALETEITDTTQRNPALENAWRRFALYGQTAIVARKRFFRLRTWVLVLGVMATILALVHSTLDPIKIPWIVWVKSYLRFLVIGTPVLVSVLLTGSVKLERRASWVLLRGSAEALKRQIYRYRAQVGIYSPEKTKTEPREVKLARKVKTISGQLMKTEVSQISLTPYEDTLPPQFGVAEDDDGFSDLGPERYLAWRLEDQLNWHQGKAVDLGKRLQRLQWLVYALSGVGTFLAAVGLEVWIAVTTAMVSALMSFLELKQIETTLTDYNQTATYLEGILIWWHALRDEDRVKAVNKEKLVENTEMVLQTEPSWVWKMRDLLAELYEESEASGETYY